MADYDSSLPVRTENDGDVVAKISDSTIPSQQLTVNADGSVNVTDNGGSLTVDAADLDIRDLSSSTDSVAIGDGTDTLGVNADGSINSVVTATDLDIRDLNATTDSVALSDGTDTLGVNADGSINVVVAGSGGDNICEFNTSASVVKDASVNHDYTVTAGKILCIEEILASGSGKIKVEVQVNGATVFVGFNSTANPNVRFPAEQICKANAGEIVRIIITNRDNQPQDLYSTLLGVEM